MPGRRIFLFANGDCHDLSFYRQQINPDDRVISVNGGSRHVLEMGLRPAAVVGTLIRSIRRFVKNWSSYRWSGFGIQR